jgi:hypothetical protein
MPGWRKSSHSGNGGTNCVEVGAISWRKSTYSGNGGTACVEIGSVPWRKSTYSGNGGVDCVEVGPARGAVLIRDTKDNGSGPVLRVTAAEWQRFTRVVRVRLQGVPRAQRRQEGRVAPR